jgi:hypothetical protein
MTRKTFCVLSDERRVEKALAAARKRGDRRRLRSLRRRIRHAMTILED